ncbi:hypothetical protein EUGRSUZ_G02166 [Eucalyptus grandis]|uniref:Uncharacterized protein n=2 Tax=Eucalyptus grandis TaxID=71139 RepID=A0ACC3K5M4_EUCGR|nr:hypothetical protein EUGRSUZ_G02166 [Eucalyptus grandis]
MITIEATQKTSEPPSARCRSSSLVASSEYRTNSVLLYFAMGSFEAKVPSKLNLVKCSSPEDFVHQQSLKLLH